MFAVVSIWMTPSGIAQAQFLLPDLAESSDRFLPPILERKIKRTLLGNLNQHLTLNQDVEVYYYLRQLGMRLSSVTKRDGIDEFHFLVNQDSIINAFAAPGGIICINSGIFTKSANESELAAVVAHELAHLFQGHIARSIEYADSMKIPLLLAVLGGIALTVLDPNAGIAALALTQDTLQMNLMQFSRDDESEADRIGMHFLEQAGFSIDAMPSFFGKLLRESRYRGAAIEFLQTHPLTEKRLADTHARIDNAGYVANVDHVSSDGYWVAKTKLLVQEFQIAEHAITYFRDRLKSVVGREKTAMQYGLMLSFMRSRELDKATQQFALLRKTTFSPPSLLIARSKIEALRGHHMYALHFLKKADDLYPDNWIVAVNYVRALLDAGSAQKAYEVLMRYNRSSNIHDAKYYQFLAKTYNNLGDHERAALLHSDYLYSIGNTEDAIGLLASLDSSNLHDPGIEKSVDTKLARWKKEIEEEERIKI